MHLGVDVGGTNTDAVIMERESVVASAKSPTTENVGDGIVSVLTSVMERGDVKPADIHAVMIGTTQFTNAVVERKHLSPVATVRICLPATDGLPPGMDWPDDLARLVCAATYQVHGGYEFDGREIHAIDEAEIRRAGKEIKQAGIRRVAISSVFAPVNSAMEERAAEWLRDEIPGCQCFLSSALGRIGLLERENATMLNASLSDLAERVVLSFEEALRSLNITAPLFISQNDGTLMKAAEIMRDPVLTIASGPTNSMRGAVYLTGLKDALVVDIGGTTTDIGMLVNGFPRVAPTIVEIGGVRANFRMPDVLSIGLGGGSIIRTEPALTIGPDSVGYRLRGEARVFGGKALTATDIAVAAGRADIGKPASVASLAPDLIAEATALMEHIIEEGADRMKITGSALPVIVVGGGSILLGDDLRGASKLIRPGHFEVANAIGAAIAEVGGEVDRVFRYEEQGRDHALATAKECAIAAATNSGADPDTISVVEVEEVPLAYLPGGAVRVRAKAVGSLAF